MSWILREKEIHAVLGLDGPARYQYCIQKVADQEQLWSLRYENGWALAGDDTGRNLVPIWPHEAFASLAAIGAWANYLPEAIPIDAWLERWLPGLERDGHFVAVFPTPLDKGVVVTPDRMQVDLNDELSKYE